MIVRVARELHITLTEAFQLPASEILLWQQVYQMEYEEQEANKQNIKGCRTKNSLSANSLRDKLKVNKVAGKGY